MKRTQIKTLAKAASGIQGFDEITGGGLPRARPTLVCGGPGCGKTLFALEFVLRGARDFGEPGVVITFEEAPSDLERNVASMGFDVASLVAKKELVVDRVRVDRSEIEETGDYDLEGLFVRIKHAVDSVRAKRVVLDTVEALFAGLSNQAVLRSELQRLLNWFKDQGLTVVITGEKGDGPGLTRQGLEEYVSDCVISLDLQVHQRIATRQLRIVKYRGSMHGTNEYPFLIDEDGISIFPISSLRLEHAASKRRVSTGIAGLDAMLSGGPYEGSTILASGSAGTGKTTLAASFASAVCGAGGRCLYVTFEESPAQLMRNMKAIGMDLEKYRDRLIVEAVRPTIHGLEQHVVRLRKLVELHRPKAVVIDPLSGLIAMGEASDVRLALARIIDYFKGNGMTAFMTVLTEQSAGLEESRVGISSLVDTWLLLRDIEQAGERNRALFIIKSRGMAHSNQVREFRLTSGGVVLREPYIGPEGPLMGTARLTQETQDAIKRQGRKEEISGTSLLIAAKKKELSSQMETLKRNADVEIAALEARLSQAELREGELREAREAMATARGDASKGNGH